MIVASDDGEIANILIVALPFGLRDDEGLVRIRILRRGRYTQHLGADLDAATSNHRESNRPRLKNSQVVVELGF